MFGTTNGPTWAFNISGGPVSAPTNLAISTYGSNSVTLIGKNIQWDLKQLYFVANKKVTVTVDNEDTSLGAPHNFGLFTNAQRTADKEIFKPAKDVSPGQKFDYVVPALKAGTYYFQCDIHTSMNGTVTVK